MLMSKTLIIAEAGVNHNGSLELALQLVEAASAAGADVVKFQTFNAEQLVTNRAKKAEYQAENTQNNGNQLDMLKKLQLSHADHLLLIKKCDELGIRFMSTAFDSESLQFLAQLQLPVMKIPSGEITNAPLLLQYARTGADIILSTGVSTLSEIRDALGVLAYGMTTPATQLPTSSADFVSAFHSAAGQEQLKQKVTLLHCTTEYPAPFADINLKAMNSLRQEFGLAVGYSDHSQGIVVPMAAVARDATVIEKHFTLDKNLPGPDHQASLEPAELKAMVDGIRQVELVLGHGRKEPAPSELKNRILIRKSLVAARPLKAGDTFKAEDLVCKRPGDGKSPFDYWQLLGSTINRDYQHDELIDN